MFWFNGEYLPKVIYLSGDIYERINRVVKVGDNSGQDIEYIKELYGEKVLQNQVDEITNIYDQVYATRLILTGNKDGNSLIIKPNNKLCKTTFIQELKTIPKFEWYYTTKDGVENIDHTKQDGRNSKQYEQLSLTDAFCLWLNEYKTKLDIRQNVTQLDIIELYILKKKRQAPKGLDDVQKKIWKTQLERSKSKAKMEGDRLFLQFLSQELINEDKLQLEMYWNRSYNNYMHPDYEKIPVAFNVTKEFWGEDPFIVKPEKREAVSFILNQGSGCLAYDVGVGKTMANIMIVEQFLVAGYCKRPFIVVPNQTYKQWISEIRNVLPHREINDFYNFDAKHIKKIAEVEGTGKKMRITKTHTVNEGSITVITYEGFNKIGFNETTNNQLFNELYTILNQGDQEAVQSETKRAKFETQLEERIGKGLEGTLLTIEDLGFDFMSVDEAHAMKKVFTNVASEKQEGKKGRRVNYTISAGQPSAIATKGFMIAQYILRNNKNRNVVLLTATPFTNSPLEIYSMLSLVAYQDLKNMGMNNINTFFDNFVGISDELTINHKLQPVYKQVIKSFDNLPALHKVISKYFNYKTGDDVGVVRPNKYVLPYFKELKDNIVSELSTDQQVSTYLEPLDQQREYIDLIKSYAKGDIERSQLEGNSLFEDERNRSTETSEEIEVDEESMGSQDRDTARAIVSMNLMRDVTLSPYLYKYNDLGKPTAEQFIESSPKLIYTIDCIRTVKQYHEGNNQPVSGQVIYIDRGIKYFPLIKEYLIKNVGFKKHEVGIIEGSMQPDKRREVQNGFLGRKFDEKKQDFVKISDDERIKVLIGSSSIKEGMNLQKKSTVLYNLFIDWNPTDNLQLAGRVWRQGNEYKNVRIVNPLLTDSSDIFMFQKLEEKSSRINTIWSNDGRSALNLDEFNPEELKMALIKDPYALADLLIIDEKEKYVDEKRSIESLTDRIKDYEDKLDYIKMYEKDIDQLIIQLPTKSRPDNIDSKVNLVRKFQKMDKILDENGLEMVYDWEYRSKERTYGYNRWIEWKKTISPKRKPTLRPYWWNSLTLALRVLRKEDKDLLGSRGYSADQLDFFKQTLKNDLVKVDAKVEKIKSKEYRQKKVDYIIEKRKQESSKIKTIDDLVKDFEKLNYLLSFKYCNLQTIETQTKESDTDIINAKLATLEGIVDIFDGSEKEFILDSIKSLNGIKDLF